MSGARGTVVVTGARGFLGQALVPSLAAAGYDVRAVVRAVPQGDAWEVHAGRDVRVLPRAAGPGGVTWHAIGDLVRADDAALHAVVQGAQAVVHLAAQAHRPHVVSDEADAALRAINAALPARLARAAGDVGVSRFVFASSVKVHGEVSPAGRGLRESDPLAPADAYGASKVAAEASLAEVASATGLVVTALRLPLVYGPGAKANFAALIRAVRAGTWLPVGSIDNRRSLLAIGNFTSAVQAVLEDAPSASRAPFTPYLLADDAGVSTPGLVRALAAALHVAPRIVPFPASLLRAATVLPGIGPRLARLVHSLAIDASAFRTAYAWTPPVTLAAGLAAAVQEAPPL